MMEAKVFQTIYDEIAKYVDFSWKRLIVYLEYGENSYTFSFYVKTGKTYTKCFDIPNISEEDLMSSFRKIDKVVSKERRKIKHEKWSNLTMVVSNDGQMHTDFDYTDLSEGTYQFKKEWKKKYLV